MSLWLLNKMAGQGPTNFWTAFVTLNVDILHRGAFDKFRLDFDRSPLVQKAGGQGVLGNLVG